MIELNQLCKRRFLTHSEGDLSDNFELESEGLQEKVTDCIPVMMVNCHDQGSLWKQKGVIINTFKNSALCLQCAKEIIKQGAWPR